MKRINKQFQAVPIDESLAITIANSPATQDAYNKIVQFTQTLKNATGGAINLDRTPINTLIPAQKSHGLIFGRTKAMRRGGLNATLFKVYNAYGANRSNLGATPDGTQSTLLDLILPKDAQGLPAVTIQHSLDNQTIIGLSAGIAGAMVVANLINRTFSKSK